MLLSSILVTLEIHIFRVNENSILSKQTSPKRRPRFNPWNSVALNLIYLKILLSCDFVSYASCVKEKEKEICCDLQVM